MGKMPASSLGSFIFFFFSPDWAIAFSWSNLRRVCPTTIVMGTLWRTQLFGGLRAEQEGRVVTRFRTQKAASLLAYLAYHRQRSHPREVLIELLWPECEVDVARH